MDTLWPKARSPTTTPSSTEARDLISLFSGTHATLSLPDSVPILTSRLYVRGFKNRDPECISLL